MPHKNKDKIAKDCIKGDLKSIYDFVTEQCNKRDNKNNKKHNKNNKKHEKKHNKKYNKKYQKKHEKKHEDNVKYENICYLKKDDNTNCPPTNFNMELCARPQVHMNTVELADRFIAKNFMDDRLRCVKTKEELEPISDNCRMKCEMINYYDKYIKMYENISKPKKDCIGYICYEKNDIN